MFYDELSAQANELSEQAESSSNFDGLKEPDTLGNIEGEVISVAAEVRNDIAAFDGSDVIVTGAPFDIAKFLDSVQGDNVYGFLGDCGLTSVANFMTLCGDLTTEDEIVHFAAKNGLCAFDPESDPSSWGGIDAYGMAEILDAYGIDADVFFPGEEGGSLEDIAKAIEDGHVVSVGINAGYLWDSPDCVDDGSANHAITVTGTVRDPETGELSGFVICDSGRGLDSDSCRVITVDEFDECYSDVPGASAVISDVAYRATDEVIEI